MARKGHYIRCFGHIIDPKKPFLRLDSPILQPFNLEPQNNFHDHLHKQLFTACFQTYTIIVHLWLRKHLLHVKYDTP